MQVNQPQAITVRQRITNEERSLIRDNVILLMMLEMIDHNRKLQESTGNILKPMYLAVTDYLIDLVHADAVAVKRQLKAASIKWWDKQMTDFILTYSFVCRGFEGDFSITRDVAKSQLSIKFSHTVPYIQQLKSRSTK